MALNAPNVRPLPSLEPLGGTLVLEHRYELAKRLAVGGFFETYTGVQNPFRRPVLVRLYRKLTELGLSEAAVRRIRASIRSGCESEWAVDHGEVEGGLPFIVMQAPEGKPLIEAWREAGSRAPRQLANLGKQLCQAVAAAPVAGRAELALERVCCTMGGEGPRLEVICLGELPTRPEVREINGTVPRDLVVAFPPECFAGPGAEADEVERTGAADVYRVAAILYHLATGEHPYFPVDGDVAGAIANLVTDTGRRPGPAKTGSASLDQLLAQALSIDPATRPSWERFCAGLGGLASDTVRVPVEAPASAAPKETAAARTGLPPVVRNILFMAILVAACVVTYLWSQRPPEVAAVLITSEPSGVVFESATVEGGWERLGRTPILLPEQDIDAPISLRPIYEDGRIGATQTVSPDALQSFDACRSLRVEFAE